MSIRHIAVAGNLILAFGGALAAAHGAAADLWRPCTASARRAGQTAPTVDFPEPACSWISRETSSARRNRAARPFRCRGSVRSWTPNGTKPRRTARDLHVFCTGDATTALTAGSLPAT